MRTARLTDRLAFRAAFLLCMLSGKAAARLAADFRELGSMSPRLWPVSLLLQLPVLACWLVMRPLSLSTFALCSAIAPRLQQVADTG